MIHLVERLAVLERTISAERGGFWLFALLLREDAPNRWDLVVSAPWTQGDQSTALRYMADQLGAALQPEDLTLLSRIVLIDKSNPDLGSLARTARGEHGPIELRNRTLFGLAIAHAYIFTAKMPDVSTRVPVA